jgi:DNA-binding PadR family transcriptional regulator
MNWGQEIFPFAGLDMSPIEVYDADMMPRALHTQTPGRQAVDYTDRAYWNGLIKMSLSKFFILCVLQTRPMHGYEIARTVERTSKGCCSPAEGTIYPVLREFEQGGYVTAHTEIVQGRQRKIYAITDRGRAAFQVAVDAWMEATKCLVQHECVVGGPIAPGKARE